MAILDNLMAHWKLNEASGARADAHTGGLNLTDVNTVTQAAGKIGNAAQFTSGQSERLTHADHADLTMGDIDYLLAAWVYLDSKAAQLQFMAKMASSNFEFRFGYDVAADRFFFEILTLAGTGQVELADNLGAVSINTWYFVLGWLDAVANTVNIQVNDGTVDSAAQSQTPGAGTAEFEMGAERSAQFMNGRMDSVSIWKRVLTSQERTDLYNGGAGLDYPFTVAAGNPWNAYAQQ